MISLEGYDYVVKCCKQVRKREALVAHVEHTWTKRPGWNSLSAHVPKLADCKMDDLCCHVCRTEGTRSVAMVTSEGSKCEPSEEKLAFFTKIKDDETEH